MPSNSISDNTLTLQTYKSKLQKYIDSTPEKINDAELPWIDTSLGLISPKEKILELGSGFGRNAVYIQSKGYDIECTDAVADFIPIMQSRQLDARLLDALTDDFGGGYGLVFANGVLVHFTHDETRNVINKTYAALNSNGIFAFSLKQGYGSVWTNEKLDAPRFYQYWQPEEIEQLLTEQGFELLDILEGPTSQRNAGWLYIIARKVTS